MVRQIEKLPSLAKDELGVPDACLMFFDEVLAFDHVKKEILLVVTADLTRLKPRGGVQAGDDAAGQAGDAGWRVRCPDSAKKKTHGKLKITSRTSKKRFLTAVEKTKEYIAAGDVFQA